VASTVVALEPAEVSVDPGERAVVELRVRNDGPSERYLTFAVPGGAASWVSISPFALSIGPGDEATARIFLRPPNTAAVSAGLHDVAIEARGRDQGPPISTTLKVHVGTFQAVSVALGPDHSSGNGTARSRLTIDNLGNAPVRATLVGSAPDADVTVTAQPALVAVEPGARAEVQVDVHARRRPWGHTQERTFTVRVMADGVELATVDGTAPGSPIASRRLMLGIVAPVALVVLALLARLVVFPSSKTKVNRLTAATPSCPGAGHLAHDADGLLRHNVIEPENYSFLFLDPGGCLPVRWNPCLPIHYAINGSQASAAQVATTRQAVAEVSQATGIAFVFDGSTTQDATNRPDFDPIIYGPRWAPVLIDWTHLGGTNSLTEVAGGGVPNEVDGVYVSGIVVLNLDAHLANNAPLPTGFGAGVTWGRIVLHELGHVVGLGHVTDVDQIMHDPVTEQVSPTSAYGIGDLAGLRLLGRSAGCLATPAVPTAPTT
jgi:hypothetical protein